MKISDYFKRKTIRFTLSLFLVALFCNMGYAQQKDLPFGINLAGAEFAHKNTQAVYGQHYVYPGPKDLDYFKSKGLTLMRVPFLWERIQPVLGGELDPEEFGRLKKFITQAKERNLLVIPDMHNYCRRNINGKSEIIGSSELSIADVADVWKKLAAGLKSFDNIWGYGIMNEPHDLLESTPWINIAQEIITEIRKEDVKTPILVGGDSWSSAERWTIFSDNLKYLKDPSENLIFEAHVYFDNNASGIYKKSYEEEGASATTGISRTIPFVNWLKQNNLRGFIGEYGVPDNDPKWLITLDKFLAYIQSNGINGTYWAAGPIWGKYFLSVEPNMGEDRPQMKVLQKYKSTKKVSKK